jgi:hypothetical protein
MLSDGAMSKCVIVFLAAHKTSFASHFRLYNAGKAVSSQLSALSMKVIAADR